jgi:hypothetical protein
VPLCLRHRLYIARNPAICPSPSLQVLTPATIHRLCLFLQVNRQTRFFARASRGGTGRNRAAYRVSSPCVSCLSHDTPRLPVQPHGAGTLFIRRPFADSCHLDGGFLLALRGGLLSVCGLASFTELLPLPISPIFARQNRLSCPSRPQGVER